MADQTPTTGTKVLSINFGSYVCELEGFSNPFRVIRGVVDYFAELADEYPDTEALDLHPDTDHLQRVLIDSAGDPYVRIVEIEGGVRMRTLQDQAAKAVPAVSDEAAAPETPEKAITETAETDDTAPEATEAEITAEADTDAEPAAEADTVDTAADSAPEEVDTSGEEEIVAEADGSGDDLDEDMDVEELAAVMAGELADEGELSLDGLDEDDDPASDAEDPLVAEAAEDVAAASDEEPEVAEADDTPAPVDEPVVAEDPVVVEEPVVENTDAPTVEPMVLSADDAAPEAEVEEPMVLSAEDAVEDDPAPEPDEDVASMQPVVIDRETGEEVADPAMFDGDDGLIEEPMVLEADDEGTDEPLELSAADTEEPLVLEAGADETGPEPELLEDGEPVEALSLDTPISMDDEPELIGDDPEILGEEPEVLEGDDDGHPVSLRLSDAEIEANRTDPDEDEAAALRLSPEDADESADGDEPAVSLRVLSNDEAEDEPVSLRTDAPKRSLRIIRTDEEEEIAPTVDAGDGAEIEHDDSELRAFAKRMGAASLPELLEASAAYVTLVDNQQQFSRKTILQMVDEISDEKNYTAEARIKSFGKLLRSGKIMRVEGGQFAISQALRFNYESRM